MSPPPPRSTLFPYTTLFRSKMASRFAARLALGTLGRPLAAQIAFQEIHNPPRHIARVDPGPIRDHMALPGIRSEEHTSELQSPVHLVCRLLLEKKKKSPTPV